MITRVRITGYKSLEDVEIKFRPLTVVFGPNASGKSNLFDALGLVARMVTQKTLKDAFSEHRGAPLEAFWAPEGLKGLLGRASASFTIEVDVELSRAVIKAVERAIGQMREGLAEREPSQKRRVIERFLRYKVTVEIRTDSGMLRVRDEHLTALKKDGTPRLSRTPFIEKVQNKLHLRMEGQGHPIYYTEGLDHTVASTSLYAPHYPHITALKEELARWRFYYFEPKSMRSESDLRVVEHLGAYGAELSAFFNTLKSREPRQFAALNKALSQILPAVDGVDIDRTPEGLLRLAIHERGVPYTARVVSEGTLRILGLLAITSPLSPTAVVGYEEPENGVHPRRLRMIAEVFESASKQGTCQYIINTHSPILPDYFPNESLVLCRRRNGGSEFVPFASLGPLFRSNEIALGLEEAGDDHGHAPLSIGQRLLRGDFEG